MERKKVFKPGEMVSTFTGQVGMVISEDVYSKNRLCLKEAKRPGHYFAPGCCHHPDYIIQVPVVFEDGAYDVMRAMNIKRAQDVPAEKKAYIQNIINNQNVTLVL